jgi:hypothetical protein
MLSVVIVIVVAQTCVIIPSLFGIIGQKMRELFCPTISNKRPTLIKRLKALNDT